MVLPSHQRRGIKTALMRHEFEELGADTLPTWLVTQVRGRQMYQTLGFEDVGVVDIDFSEFMGKYKGFGVHRNICMIRQPRGVPSSGPRPTISDEIRPNRKKAIFMTPEPESSGRHFRLMAGRYSILGRKMQLVYPKHSLASRNLHDVDTNIYSTVFLLL